MKFNEVKKKISAKDDPCWSGYHMVGTKTKNGREVPNCVPGKKGVSESADEVKQAIINRIMRQHVDMISQVGPEALMSAIDEVGDSIGDVEEIGTSDVSAWVNTVKQYLTRRMAGESRGMTKGHDESHGSPYDRGSADSWYSRPRRPHKGGVGGDSGPESINLTPDEIKAYHAGYDDNEKSGGKKSWESADFSEATDVAEPKKKVEDGYIRMLMYKLKNDRPLSRREREDLEQHLKVMGFRLREGVLKCESLRTGEYHLVQVKLDNGETRKVKVYHDEGVGEYIKNFFARQGHQVVDYEVDYSVRTEAMKLSDLPPAMRRRLSMKDVEAERPKGAFRYRVGDKEFMSRDAAASHAFGTGEKVEPIYKDDDVKERELTAHELERREEIVKGMKKAKGDFEKRYGNRAKSVMYATATKMAKNEDINESLRLAADEGHYYCEADRQVKPIPEGYAKVANGYIMKKI